MVDRWGRIVRLRERLRDSVSTRISFIAALAVVFGGVIVLITHAAGSFQSIEPETGSLSSCASKVTDASASGGLAVKFGSCAAGGQPPMSLDQTGQTIPDTNYAVPAGAIFMATTGSDTNAGTQAAPVKTLNKAVSLVPTGGTIVVRGGTDANPAVYRDWYYFYNSTIGANTFAVIGKKVTIQAYPHEKAWFDGTDVVTNWTSDGAGHWYTAWNTPSFCGTLPTASTSNYYSVSLASQNIGATGNTGNGPCAWRDASLDSANPMAGDPQMVFIDGAYMHESPTLSGATNGAFYYDWANKRIYISTNPSGRTVELAARPMAMQINGVGSKVLGIGFKRYASHVYSNNNGVIYADGGQTFENVVFTQNAGHALMLNKPVSTVIDSSIFAYNGANGIAANGSRGSGGTDNTVIKNSMFNHNNTELFWTGCSYSCAYANIKLNNMVGFTIENNIIRDTQGDGLGAWCDIACTNGTFVYNTIFNNGSNGILYEISDTGIIASNLVYNNGTSGIRVASAHTKVYNNTIVNNNTTGSFEGNFWTYDDPRTASNPDTGNTGASAVGPDTTGLNYANNIIAGNGRIHVAQGASGDTNTNPETFWSLFDYDAYWRPQGSGQVMMHWLHKNIDNTYTTSDYTSLSSFASARSSFESHGVDITGASDPFFVDAANGNYNLKAGNQAGTGTTIPADVLSALGLSSGTGLPKGAINWPGKP